MNENQKLQYSMHKDFFERCNCAIRNGFYMEAIIMEYAAIESRLEILLGIVGLPCNKFMDDSSRKNIKISHRVFCANHMLMNSTVFHNTKLNKKFFDKLSIWITKRNQYIHGLYKNELRYSQRIAQAKEFAEKGYEYCSILYNEVNRVKRLCKRNPQCIDEYVVCKSDGCYLKKVK